MLAGYEDTARARPLLAVLAVDEERARARGRGRGEAVVELVEATVSDVGELALSNGARISEAGTDSRRERTKRRETMDGDDGEETADRTCNNDNGAETGTTSSELTSFGVCS